MNRSLATALAASIAGGVCVILTMLPPVQRLEQELGLRWLFQLRGSRQPPEDILLVTMNADSAARIFLPGDPGRYHRCTDLHLGRAPGTHVALPELPARWPRCIHARLVDALSDAGARLVVFDVLFRPRGPDAAQSDDVNAYQDRALATAMANAGNVLLAEKVESAANGVDTKLAQLSTTIADGALGSAPFPLLPSATRRIDRFAVFYEDGWSRPTLPMLALQAAHLDGYPGLLHRLTSAAPEAASYLPLSIAEIRQQRRLQSLTLHLRQIFLEHPVPTHIEAGISGASTREPLAPLLAAYGGDATRWLNFYGPSGSMRSIGLDEALALRGAQASASGISADGKFVFVGYVEHGRQEQVEHFSTPYSTQDRSDLSGLEILATAFANLQRNESLSMASVSARAAAVFSGAALAAVAAIAFGLWGGVGATAVLGAGWAWAATMAFSVGNLCLPMFSMLAMALPLGCAAGIATRYLHARRDRAQLRRTLAALVPTAVAEALSANAGEARQFRATFDCVCVATDVAQFTKLAERMRSEALAELLNRYFDDLLRPVAAHRGFVADIVGDAMLAVWRLNAREVRKEACLALLEMAEATARFNANAPDCALPTRFGADLGQITLRSLGAEHHFEYRAIGDTVNTASRVQDLNRHLGTRILVSHGVAEGLGEFLVRDLGRFMLRGKSIAVDVAELVGLRSGAEPRLVELCERFDQAMRLFRSGRKTEALAILDMISKDYPQDRASRFYIEASFSGSRRRDDAIIAL